MAYSVAVSYCLWLLFGWLGAHHFYLRRDRHAFVWFWTLGGGFGLGWLLEITRLPEYVRLADFEVKCTRGEAIWGPPFEGPPFEGPPVSLKRVMGELVFSCMLGAIAIATVPPAWYWLAAPFVIAMAVGIGVHTVANIGNEQCSICSCLIGAALPTPLLLLSAEHAQIQNVLCYSVLAATIITNWRGRAWRARPPRRRRACTRLMLLAAAGTVVSGLLVGAVYYNGSITNKYGEKIPIRDAVWNVLESPAWAEFRMSVKNLLRYLYYDGWTVFFHQLAIELDYDGEESAYQTLNVTSDASEADIRIAYKQLARQYHPDKVHSQTDDEKKRTEEKFVKIQKAYERLSSLKSRRNRKNEL